MSLCLDNTSSTIWHLRIHLFTSSLLLIYYWAIRVIQSNLLNISRQHIIKTSCIWSITSMSYTIWIILILLQNLTWSNAIFDFMNCLLSQSLLFVAIHFSFFHRDIRKHESLLKSSIQHFIINILSYLPLKSFRVAKVTIFWSNHFGYLVSHLILIVCYRAINWFPLVECLVLLIFSVTYTLFGWNTHCFRMILLALINLFYWPLGMYLMFIINTKFIIGWNKSTIWCNLRFMSIFVMIVLGITFYDLCILLPIIIRRWSSHKLICRSLIVFLLSLL